MCGDMMWALGEGVGAFKAQMLETSVATVLGSKNNSHIATLALVTLVNHTYTVH